MKLAYTPQEHVCTKTFFFEVDDETHKILNFDFKGGCPGNLQGIGRLIKGMTLEQVIERFTEMPICPTSKVSSCPEQIRKGLIEIKYNLENGIKPASPIGLSPFGKM